jgi:hypothetical protein
MLFSQRKGLKPAQKPLQVEAIDDDLRNSLWSAVHEALLREYEPPSGLTVSSKLEGSNLDWLFRAYWMLLFKWPTDQLPYGINDAIKIVRDQFYRFLWYEVYDFLEFTAANAPEHLREHVRTYVNSVLRIENAGYRFLGAHIAEISSEEEVSSIVEAMATPIAGANAHIEAAVALLSDKKNPDYRNSIKESISAVESISRAVVGDPKATLGAALSALQARIELHPAFRSALSALYGFTSDAAGIRHAMLEQSSVTHSDAKFMLVVCSAFVNFVIEHASDGRIVLKTT